MLCSLTITCVQTKRKHSARLGRRAGSYLSSYKYLWFRFEYVHIPRTVRECYYSFCLSLPLLGDNILTAISVGRDCELVRPDQTVIRVEAELVADTYSQHLNVSYTLEENEKSNIVHDVSVCLLFCLRRTSLSFALLCATFNFILAGQRSLINCAFFLLMISAIIWCAFFAQMFALVTVKLVETK